MSFLLITGFGGNLSRILTNNSRDRPGARVAKRRRCQSKIGVNHRITTSETMKWYKTKYDGIIR